MSTKLLEHGYVIYIHNIFSIFICSANIIDIKVKTKGAKDTAFRNARCNSSD